jgi:flagellin-like protein
MKMSLLLLFVVVLLLLGALPTWPYAANWGYGPSGVIGVVLLILVVLLLVGRI